MTNSLILNRLYQKLGNPIAPRHGGALLLLYYGGVCPGLLADLIATLHFLAITESICDGHTETGM